MSFHVAGSEGSGGWWLVVAKDRGCTTICTVNLGLLPQIRGVKGVGDAHMRVRDVLSDHVDDASELLTYMFNPNTSGYIPYAEKCAAEPKAEAKFVYGFPWFNANAEPRAGLVEQLLLELGIEPHFLNRKLAAMAERRVVSTEVPVPIYCD